MSFTQISDLASIIGMRARQTQIKSALDTASQELVSGEKSNLVQAAGGDLNRLFHIENRLGALTSDIDTLRLAAGKTNLMQISLERVADGLTDFGPSLLSTVNSGDIRSMEIVGTSARDKLEAAVSALNARYGNQSLFAGTAVDQPALAPASDILSDISAIVSGAANASAAIAAIDSYFFDPAGGFETSIYRGSTQDIGAAHISDGSQIDYGIRADSIPVRQSLRALAMAAVAADPATFSGTPDQVALLKEAAESAINAGNSVLRARETLGFAEENIQNAKAHTLAQQTAFNLERNGLRSVDPYEAASKLQELQTQLQTMYAMTARLSGLSLTNYLR